MEKFGLFPTHNEGNVLIVFVNGRHGDRSIALEE
jgi:hypothetical protein